MGMYTLFHIDVTFKPETPPEVIEAIKAMVNGDDVNAIGACDNKCFSLHRVKEGFIFKCQSTYFRDSEQFLPTFTNEYAGETYYWHLKSASSIKNYESEIEQFTAWMTQFLDSGIIYSRYEETPHNKILFAKEHGSYRKDL